MTDQKAQSIFSQLINRYPGICKSSAPAFRSVLWSFLRDAEPWRIAVLVASFECNAANIKLTTDPRLEATDMVFMLENGYGIDFEKAVWAISCWCKALGIAWQRPVASNEKRPVEDHIASANSTSTKEVTDTIISSDNLRICAHCHTENNSDSLYCRKCGSVLVHLCPNCEALYGDGDTFCSKCGQRLDIEPEQQLVAVDTPYASCKPGDIISFGQYTLNSDGNLEPLEWVALKRFETKLLLVTRCGITSRQYHHDTEGVRWCDSDMRRWLNGEFYTKVFSEKEKGLVINSSINNWDNEKYGTPGGDSTTDNVFLLSIDEVQTYFQDDASRCCEPTPYALAKGAFAENGNCWWWLRSPGVDSAYAAGVSSSGVVRIDGNFVTEGDDCVRPAIFLRLQHEK